MTRTDIRPDDLAAAARRVARTAGRLIGERPGRDDADSLALLAAMARQVAADPDAYDDGWLPLALASVTVGLEAELDVLLAADPFVPS